MTGTVTLTPKQQTEVDNFTKYTYYLASFGGVLRTFAAAIEKEDLFKSANTTDKANIINLTKQLYELVVTLDNNIISAIDTIKQAKEVTYTLPPMTITAAFPAIGSDPSVIQQAWSAASPIFQSMIPNLDGDPILLETAKAILKNGESIVSATASLIAGTPSTPTN